MLFIKSDKDEQHDHSHRDGNVSHVENRPAGHAVTGKVDEQKVEFGYKNIKKLEIQKIHYTVTGDILVPKLLFGNAMSG